jgi:hypothetical protein
MMRDASCFSFRLPSAIRAWFNPYEHETRRYDVRASPSDGRSIVVHPFRSDTARWREARDDELISHEFADSLSSGFSRIPASVKIEEALL